MILQEMKIGRKSDVRLRLRAGLFPEFYSTQFKLLYIIRGGEWSFKDSGSRKILVEFHGSRSLVF